MNIELTLRSNRTCLGLTGLRIEEFKSLVPVFSSVFDQMKRERKEDRKRKFGGGQKGGLPTGEEKLFFVLMYLKIYPTFDVASFLVGLNRSNCCRQMQFLIKVLERTLERKLVLPERKIQSVEEFLKKFPEVKDIFIDGTERRVQKPRNQQKRKKLYSGKKKATTRKSIVVNDEKKRVLALTPARSGRRHDKRLFEKDIGGKNIPQSVSVWVDTGFQGIQKDHENTQIPKKGSKKHPLTQSEKVNNRLISGIRIVAEHTIAGIKRYRASNEIYRNKLINLDDTFMLLSAGLWNCHLSFVS